MATLETPAETAAPAQAPDPTSLKSWLAVVSVAVGIFTLVTAEQLPIGLLTSVGGALHVSEGTAGLMVTVPGLVAALSAPLIPVVVGRMDRRFLLVALMTVMAVANLVTVLAPNFGILLASRVLVGVTIGGFWAVAGGLAFRLVQPAAIPRATALIFGGVAAANVLGVPTGTLIGGLAGWRTAFATLGVLAFAVLVALLVLLPSLPATKPVSVGELMGQFANRGVRSGIIATALIVTGHLAAYTYVSPMLQQVSGIDEDLISVLLLGFGVAGIIGNFVAGAAVAKNLGRTMAVIIVALAAAMLLFPLLGKSQAGGIALLVLWGLAFGGVSVSLQTWMLKSAPDAMEAASALWVSVFNLAIALGALVGGLIVDQVELITVAWLGGVVVLLTALTLPSLRTAGKAAE
ncbi:MULTISPECIES: MFS transporter [unclassified Streptomyces]|uniref:MFS transporter n=1 Tax=unclassified Streptomyces TaxID=2593676 RepID=UPI000A5ED017|nr:MULTISPECIES: MFS transporter [unclassified Streptomyces]MCX5146603.1 MFS transporter [Streptomyces sp. NBC_00320]WSN49789.1 MFS transporter [Streptomyces sp. NBC_01296]WSW60792.1 MFS transporter [Streptomyces sp. NBC_00998]